MECALQLVSFSCVSLMLFYPGKERDKLLTRRTKRLLSVTFFSLAVVQIYGPLTNISFNFSVDYLIRKDDCCLLWLQHCST